MQEFLRHFFSGQISASIQTPGYSPEARSCTQPQKRSTAQSVCESRSYRPSAVSVTPPRTQ